MGGFGSGGARNGAGRKPADGTPKQKVSVTLPAWLLSAESAARPTAGASRHPS